MTSPKTATSDLNVLILGAGVSASCGIALTKDILRQSMLKLASEDYQKAKDVNQLLAYLYQDFRDSYKNYPNIEDFLNILETARSFNSRDFIESKYWTKNDVENVKQIVLRAVTDYIWVFMTGNNRLGHIETFFREYVPLGTVVITFNWDLSVEQALSKRRDHPSIKYQYPGDRDSKGTITLLKPHGSMNWLRKADLDGLPKLKARRLDGDIFICKFVDLLLSHDLPGVTPIIVPPVFNKDFSGSTEDFNSQIFKKTWISVYKALRYATRLTILGYSLPKEDQFSKFVFRRALRNNILEIGREKKRQLTMNVVNPDEAVEGTFARLVGRDNVLLKFHRTYFQDYVKTLAGSSPDE
jgi:hypothetical protein